MSTTVKNRGGQKAWTTEEQKAWLTALIPDYLASRSSSAPGDFWMGLLEDWFKLWPLGEANTKEKEAGVTDQAQLKFKKKVSRHSPEKRKRTKLTHRSKSKIGSRITLERAREAWREGDATC
jgi:hypothetical protein